MYKIKIFSIGKSREEWLGTALSEYEKRLKGQVQIEWVLVKNDQTLIEKVSQEKGVIALDPKGKALTSPDFSRYLITSLQTNGSRLAFVIGGDIGLPDVIKQQAVGLLSLSKMTFTHQMTRLILIEQIYRALSIERGSPYHK